MTYIQVLFPPLAACKLTLNKGLLSIDDTP